MNIHPHTSVRHIAMSVKACGASNGHAVSDEKVDRQNGSFGGVTDGRSEEDV